MQTTEDTVSSVKGTITFTHVGSTRLRGIIAGCNKIGPYELWARFTGATRTGERIDTHDVYAKLVDRKVTARKLFFTIVLAERELTVRPFEDTFTEVRVTIQG